MRARISILGVMAILFGLWATGVQAQSGQRGQKPRRDFSRGEVYFGVSYARLSLQGFDTRQHSVGWGASVTGNLTRYFGITGDFGGQYNPQCPENDVECFVELLRATEIRNYSSHQFLAGPRVNIPGERFSGFVHALFGGVRTKASLLTVATGARREEISRPKFAMAFGGGMDWNLSDRFAVRLFQVDYIPVRENPDWRHNIRFQGGLVFRFGK